MSGANGTLAAAIAQAKTADLLELFGRYGVELKKRGNGFVARCPFHEDETPSLSVTPAKGLWHCFGCGAAGSAIDLVMRMEGVEMKEAARRLAGEGKGHALRPAARTPEPADPPDPALLEQAVRCYQEGLSRALKARQYLGRRGLLDPDIIERFRVGYGDGSVKDTLDPKAGKKAGVLTAQGTDRFYRSIVFPIPGADGRIVGLYGRHTLKTQHLYLRGPHRGVFNGDAVRDHHHIIICESIIDALSAYRLGVAAAVPIYGVSGLTPHHIDLFRRHPGREVTILLDSDKAGEQGTERVARNLAPLPVTLFRARLPDGVKDLNDLLVRGGTARELLAVLEAREPIGTAKPVARPGGGGAVPPVEPAPAPTPGAAAEEGLIERTDDQARFRIEGVEYAVRGIRAQPGDTLRLVITASAGEKRHVDRIDLFVARSRRAFAQEAAGRIEVEAPRVERGLDRLMEEIARLQEADRAKRADASDEKPPAITEAERAEAMALLDAPDILAEVSRDLDRLGFVGEEEAKEILYLVATSRRTERPLAAIIQSESGTGKSSLLEAVAGLMPPEEVDLVSRLTPQSLYYMPPDALRQKLLIIDERAGTEGADYSLRTLQSQRRLTLLAPMRDPATGKMRTVRFEVAGPIAYMESATERSPHPENANRCFEIVLDDSREQTERVQAMQRRAWDPAGWGGEAERETILRRHRNAQRLLEPVRVAIPFAERIRFPANSPRTRRDHERFLALVGMATFLHQRTRPRGKTPDGSAYIEATVGDYRMAWRLARRAIERGLADRSDDARTLLGVIRALIARKAAKLGLRPEEVSAGRREIRDEAGWSQRRLLRTLEELVDLDAVVAEGCKGRCFTYRVEADPADPPPIDLTAPEELPTGDPGPPASP